MNIKINYTDKKIQDIKAGEMVVSFDKDNNKFRHNFVTATHLPIVEKDRQLKITTDDGTVFINSVDHPLLYKVDDNNWDYIKSSEIKINETVLKTPNNETVITNVEKADVDEQFYDLTVENDNNFLAGNGGDNMIVGHNSATTHFPFWHSEIRDILVLKNNKGTDDNRVRKLDYSIQFSRLFYKRFMEDKDITLFSPHEVPDLYEAFFGPSDEFETLYEKYERATSLTFRTKIKARDLMKQYVEERIGTGRMYLMNVDHVNTHSSFIDKVYMSNLCLDPDTIINIRLMGEHTMDIRIEDLGFLTKEFKDEIEILSYNEETGENEYKIIEAFDLTSANAELLEITDEESGKSFRCTPEHKVYTKNRGYVMAKDLVETDELLINEVGNGTSKNETEQLSNVR